MSNKPQENFNFCGTMHAAQEKLQRRQMRIDAGDTKLAALVEDLLTATKACRALSNDLFIDEAGRFDDDTLETVTARASKRLSESAESAAQDAAHEALQQYENQLDTADYERSEALVKKLDELKADAALNGLSEESNLQMDALVEELKQLGVFEVFDNAYNEPAPAKIVIGTKPLSQTDWERLEKMSDEDIDTSDIPELTDEDWRNRRR